MRDGLSYLFKIFFVLFLLAVNQAFAQQPLGYIDRVEVISGPDSEIYVRAKVILNESGDVRFKSEAPVQIRGQNLISKHQEKSEFQVDLESPKFKKGGYFPLNLSVQDGEKLEVLKLANGQPVFAHVLVEKSRHFLILAVVLVLVIFGLSSRFQRACGALSTWFEPRKRKLIALITVAVLVLVAVG